jgi:hypothetical protein
MDMTASGRTRGAGWPAGVLAWLAWLIWALAMLALAVTPWLDHLLRQAGRPDLVSLDESGIPSVLAVVSAATVGAVLATRRPRHPVGWVLLALGLTVSLSGAADGYSRYAILARPGALPGARFPAAYNSATLAIMLGCIAFVLLLTPTGSPPSTRWRWCAGLTAASTAVFLLAVVLGPRPLDSQFHSVVINPVGVRALEDPLIAVNQVALAGCVLGVLAAAASLVVRFRRARGVERQQLRWVSLAAAPVALAALTVPAALGAGNQYLFAFALGVGAAVLPLAIGAAILRYRLYDLDRIVSRTLAYSVLTVLLGGGYAGVVLGLGQLLGKGSSLVVAGATLMLAAVFQPARRRIQQMVDRRFNRRRYDAAMTISAFSARLRQHVDLLVLTAELLAVVDQTMQPTQASLWLRPTPKPPR